MTINLANVLFNSQPLAIHLTKCETCRTNVAINALALQFFIALNAPVENNEEGRRAIENALREMQSQISNHILVNHGNVSISRINRQLNY